jgi:hypothetical protein
MPKMPERPLMRSAARLRAVAIVACALPIGCGPEAASGGSGAGANPSAADGTVTSPGTTQGSGGTLGQGIAGAVGAAGMASNTGVAGVASSAGAAGALGALGTSGATATSGAAGAGGASARGAAGATGAGATGGAGAVAAGTGNPTLWIAGDSTVMTYAAGNTDGANMVSIEGWGQELGQFFNDRVTISNQAIGGRSVAFFMWSIAKDGTGAYQCTDDQGNPQYQLDAAGNRVDTAQWGRIKSGIKAGDFLLVQFGTNDETHTCPRYVSLSDFETDLGIMADAVRAKGATPIFVTPMGHRSFSGSTVRNTLLPYANAMKDEATKAMVEVEDLNLRSMEYYMSVGDAYLASNIFDGGTTHFIKAGATKMAELIAGEVRKNNGPLAGYLK